MKWNVRVCVMDLLYCWFQWWSDAEEDNVLTRCLRERQRVTAAKEGIIQKSLRLWHKQLKRCWIRPWWSLTRRYDKPDVNWCHTSHPRESLIYGSRSYIWKRKRVHTITSQAPIQDRKMWWIHFRERWTTAQYRRPRPVKTRDDSTQIQTIRSTREELAHYIKSTMQDWDFNRREACTLIKQVDDIMRQNDVWPANANADEIEFWSILKYFEIFWRSWRINGIRWCLLTLPRLGVFKKAHSPISLLIIRKLRKTGNQTSWLFLKCFEKDFEKHFFVRDPDDVMKKKSNFNFQIAPVRLKIRQWFYFDY